MTAYFITATGTEIGKTELVTRICNAYPNSTVLKPVISGFDPQVIKESDTARILEALGKPLTEENIQAISPWRFKLPASPDIAAAREQRTVSFDELIEYCKQVLKGTPSSEIALIEGVGGVMSPVTSTHTCLELIKALDIEPILVTKCYLGAISHTLTAIKALESEGIAINHIVISEQAPQERVEHQEMIKALEKHAQRTVHIMPYQKGYPEGMVL